MRFWIVSPNVKRDSNANGWTASICRTNCAFMGWGPEQEDKRKGYDFHHTVRRGDVILVAHRNNWDWNCVVAGIVDSDDVYEVTPDVNEVPDCAWARHLSPVISSARLNELKLATLVKKIEGAPKAQIPGAIFELTDVETTNKLQSEFDRLRVEQQARGKIDMWTSLLENSKNLILTGAPGTGKTYLAKQIAQKVIFGEAWALKDEKDFTEEERCQFTQYVGFVQFHPSYDYTDFVEGLRPKKSDANHNVGFDRRDGVFKEFCKRALQNSNKDLDSAWNRFILTYKDSALSLKTTSQKRKFIARVNGNDSFSCKSEGAESDQEQSVTKENVRTFIRGGNSNWPSYTPPLANYFKERFLRRPFVFIIDEINRGEISKIFGELFFSVDPGYRGEKGMVQSQYANMINDDDVFKNGFFVPDNVYIIGTMNDIDRSVESLDFAMRRRFVFKEITAAESAVSMNLPENLKIRMAALNTAISGINGLNSSYHIGAAYFLKDGEPADDLVKLWQLRLEPLLKEYLRGTPDAEGNIDKLKAAFESSPVV